MSLNHRNKHYPLPCLEHGAAEAAVCRPALRSGRCWLGCHRGWLLCAQGTGILGACFVLAPPRRPQCWHKHCCPAPSCKARQRQTLYLHGKCLFGRPQPHTHHTFPYVFQEADGCVCLRVHVPLCITCPMDALCQDSLQGKAEVVLW